MDRKRTASGPLSEGEENAENDSFVNRRSRPKRINLNELADQLTTTIEERTEEETTSIAPQIETENAQGIPPATIPKDDSSKITLEVLSDKIDKILGYLASNKSELTTINNRHDSRFKILESAYNDVLDNLDQANADISKNATEIARNATNIESNEACISTLKTQLRICKATNEEYIDRFKDMDSELKSLKSEVIDNKRSILDLGMDVRERRLTLSGVPEEAKEDTLNVAMTAINKILSHALKQAKTELNTVKARPRFRNLSIVDFDDVYRLGRVKGKKPRVLVITFSFTYISALCKRIYEKP